MHKFFIHVAVVLVISILGLMMEFEKFIRLGQEIGLEGSELERFARGREELLEEKKPA